MEVKVTGLRLENYKCFPEKEIKFGEKTVISGRNRSGKTTMMDAYFDIFTGKLADGTTPDKVRPHDEIGTEVPKINVVRELLVTINGEEHSIKKVTSQKWRRPRGKSEEVLDGNETVYEVDGFPMKSKDFAEFMGKIADSDTLLMCSNPASFINLMRKSTADARKHLEKLSGFDLDAFISENQKYMAVKDITKGHGIEDVIKKLKKQRNDIEKKQEAKLTELNYEKNLKLIKVEISDLELEKAMYKEQVDALDKEDADMEMELEAYEKRCMEHLQIKGKIQEIASAELVQLNAKKDITRRELATLKSKYQELKTSFEYYRDLADRSKREIENIKVAVSDIEIKLRKKQQEVFDEKERYCSYCGQELPVDRQEEILKEFERTHSSVITRFTNQLKDAQVDLKKEEQRFLNNKSKAEELIKEMEDVKTEFNKLSAKANSYPSSPDMSGNEEYLDLVAKSEKMKEELSKEVDYTSKKRANRNKRNDLLANIASAEARIKNANIEMERHEQRLDALKTELLGIGQALADTERQIDMLFEFSINKNEALGKMINQHFRHFQFRLLESTLEGNLVETCRMMVDGTDYNNGLNGGDKRLAEIDLCRGLQELNGLNLPIWCDEAGTVDSWRIPRDMEQQLILIEYKNSDFSVS